MPSTLEQRSRQALARRRAAAARQALACCHLCAHHCGTNRLKGNDGFCHAGAETRAFYAQVEVSDELELVPTFAIALSGCDLRCAFCVSGAPSWNPRAGEPVDLRKIAAAAAVALAGGARSIMILGGEPTIHLPAALEIVSVLPDDACLVWKTNAYGTADARELLDGLFDVWLPDYKFGNDLCAERLARVPHYTETVRTNLRWAAERCDVIVRHLVMPGHVDCCWRPVAEWLACELPQVKVSLKTGYWPGWQADRHPELARALTQLEAERAAAIASEYGLTLIE